jgi:hypothetical protein
MTYQQHFRPDLNLVYTRFGSNISLEELRRCAVETFRDPAYRPGMRELYDFRATTAADARLGFNTINEIHEMQTTWIRNLRQGGQVVLVATSDLVFGLCRIYASLAEQDDLAVTPCREWSAACALLGLDPGGELGARIAEA